MSPPRFQSIFFARGNLLPNGNQDHSGPQVPPHLEKPFQVAVTLLYLSTAIAQRPALKCLVPTSLRAAARSTFLTLRSMTPRLKTCYRTTIKKSDTEWNATRCCTLSSMPNVGACSKLSKTMVRKISSFGSLSGRSSCFTTSWGRFTCRMAYGQVLEAGVEL